MNLIKEKYTIKIYICKECKDNDCKYIHINMMTSEKYKE